MDYMHADQFAELLFMPRGSVLGANVDVYDIGVHDSCMAYSEAIRVSMTDEGFMQASEALLGRLMEDARSEAGRDYIRHRLVVSGRAGGDIENISPEFYCLAVHAFMDANAVYPIPRDTEAVRAVEMEYDILAGRAKRDI